MKKALLLSLTALLSTAAAQQKVAVTYSPVTVDGVTTPNGMVTINGKTYISTTALTTQGVAQLKPASFGIYRYPTAQKTPLVLQGCMGEWLFNGTDRVRVDSVVWDDKFKWHDINATLQTSVYNRTGNEHFDWKNIIVAYKDGRVVQPSKTPIQEISYSGDTMQNATNNKGIFRVKNPDDNGSETLTKLVVPAGFAGSVPAVMTFDLTCKK